MNDRILGVLNHPFIVFDDEENRYAQKYVEKNQAFNIAALDYSPSEEISVELKEDNDKDEIIYIQFSSGSTGIPRGVPLSRKNVAAEILSDIERYEMESDEILLSWSPLTHCLGLLIYHVLGVFLNVPQYLITIEKYIQNPLLWLNLIDKHRATRIGSMPFALNQLLKFYKNSDREYNWDFSCLRSVYIGGEQVNADLCNEFVKMMQPYGMRPDILSPNYGMSEACTFVSGSLNKKPITAYKIERCNLEIGNKVVFTDKDTEEVVSFVSVGEPLSCTKIIITDESHNPLPENTIGCVCVSGDNVASCYYNNESDTLEAFYGDGWLDTGDIGFMKDGNLVIIGRKKSLIVANGEKFACSDIEDIINRINKEQLFDRVVVCNGMSQKQMSEQIIVFIQTNLDIDIPTDAEKIIRIGKEIRKTVFQKAGLGIDFVIPVKKLPQTFSGKLKRRELTEEFCSGKYKEIIDKLNNILNHSKLEAMDVNLISKTMIADKLRDIINELFNLAVTDYDVPFQEYGLRSVNVPTFIHTVQREFDINIDVSVFFNYPNINVLSSYLYTLLQEKALMDHVSHSKNDNSSEDDPVVVIGMSGRFPGGANDIDEFWNILTEGVDCITDIPVDRWDSEKYYSEDKNSSGKMYCRKGGFLDTPISEFDAALFNISPMEATAMDPQHRILLELTWEAFEDADIDIKKYSGKNVGVYVGCSSTEYATAHIYSGDLKSIDPYSLTGVCMSTICGRVSYLFGFEGGCFLADTACSSVLTVLHLAQEAVKNNEVEAAVVAGMNLMLTPIVGVSFSQLQATSPDGHCKSFDASADGYGRGEGGGVIILKKLSAALKDNDRILGIIRGTGINQDGKSNGMTAPNGASQAKLMKRTLQEAGLNPIDVDYIEMHGTGTKLGDPIEAKAVHNAYCQNRKKNDPLRIGSVKSNIGHLEAAAGIASVEKVLLALQHERIPANLNFTTPNPFIDWENMPIEVVARNTDWKITDDHIRRAGINGFGFGGSNAHIIIEEYKDKREKQSAYHDGIDYVLKLSAKTEKSLQSIARKYISYLENVEENAFSDIVYSADRGRTDLEHRLAIASDSVQSAVETLSAYVQGGEAGRLFMRRKGLNYIKNRKVVFMFTGQGSQYLNMGKFLYETNELFKNELNRLDYMFKPYILKSIVNLIYGKASTSETVDRTLYSQPIIFSVEYALYKFWESLNVVPSVVIGHSIGEYVAAVVAGVISLEDAVKLVSARGRLMDSVEEKGLMATIFASESTVIKMLEGYEDRIAIAALNSPETCVISGYEAQVEEVLLKAEEKGIRVSRLKVSQAFHSMLMDPILDDFHEIAAQIIYNEPKITYISALYAKEMTSSSEFSADYWTRHIKEKVDFYHAINNIPHAQDYVYLEVGAHRILSALCKLIFDEERVYLSTLNKKAEDARQLADSIAHLYAAGVDLDWDKIWFKGNQDWKKVKLPGYVYDKSVYWKEMKYDRGTASDSVVKEDPFLGQLIESPCLDNKVIFQRKFTGTDPYFMKEHIIFNVPISPAAAYVSMILSALLKTKAPASCTLEEIEFRVPLSAVDDEQRIAQICLDNDNKASRFNIYSKGFEASDHKWLTHSTGKFAVSNEYFGNGRAADVNKLENMEFKKGDEQTVYSLMRKSGFRLGESFARITKAIVDDDKCICEIEPLKSVPNLEIYEIYPGVVDSVFVTLFWDVLTRVGMKDDGTRVTIPYFIGKLSYNYRKFEKLWCYTVSNLMDDFLVGDVVVFNEKGELMMEVSNFMGKLTNRDNLLRETRNGHGHMYYHSSFIKEELIALPQNNSKAEVMVIISDNERFGREICSKLTTKGYTAISVLRSDSYEKLDENSYKVNLSSEKNAVKLLSAIENTMKETQFNFVYCCVNDLEVMEISSDDMSDLHSLLNLIQKLSELGYYSKCRLKIITRNTQYTKDNSVSQLIQSSLWGLCKVFSMEFSKMYDGILDIDDYCFEKGIDRVITEILAHDVQEICIRDSKKRYAGRLMKHSDFIKNNENVMLPITISENAKYLITGGTGMLGLVYVESLMKLGVHKFVLLGRKQPAEKSLQKINELKAAGADIELLYADVSKYDSLKNALESLKGSIVSINGVIHAAGVLNDKMMLEHDWESFEKVLEPKIRGTINLYKLLKDNKLDFFIMVSSIASILGNIGQSNYAAANSFMNTFTDYLWQNGTAGYTFCWGPWQGGGMALTNEVTAQNINAMGMSYISQDTGSEIITEFFRRPNKNLIIADLNLEVLSGTLSGTGKEEFLSLVSEMKTEYAAAIEADTTEIMEELKALSDAEKKEYIIKKIQMICCKVMGFDLEHAPLSDTTFREMGSDSLMMFSIRSAINEKFGINIDVSILFNYPTIELVTDYLVNEILFNQEEDNTYISTSDLLSDIREITK